MEIFQNINNVGNNMCDIFLLSTLLHFLDIFILSVHYSNDGKNYH